MVKINQQVMPWKAEPCQPGQVGGGGCSRPSMQEFIWLSRTSSRWIGQQYANKVADDGIQIEEVCVENKSTAGEDFNLEKVGENKVMAEEKLNLEEISGDVEKTHLNDSMRTGPNSIEKGGGKEQDCNLGRLLEPGCVSVEFRRTEASCMAGHCLHGKVIWWRCCSGGICSSWYLLGQIPKMIACFSNFHELIGKTTCMQIWITESSVHAW